MSRPLTELSRHDCVKVNHMKNIASNLFFLIFTILTLNPAEAFRVDGLNTPENFIVDPTLGNYFISNINGEPLIRDNNGFISKVDESGKISQKLFISGTNKNTTLHAPSGLAIKDNILYITDIDSLRWFDKNTGASLGHIDFTGMGAKQLKGLAFDNKNNLYISDALANSIYTVSIGSKNKISIFKHDNRLGSPAGMVYDSARNRLIVVTQATGQVLALGRQDKKITLVIQQTFGSLQGVDWDQEGNLIISNSAEGKIYRIKKFSRTETVRENILTPTGISFDYSRNLILIPSSKGNLAFTIP